MWKSASRREAEELRERVEMLELQVRVLTEESKAHKAAVMILSRVIRG